MPSINYNPLSQGQITEDPRFNERFGLAPAGAGSMPVVWWVLGVPPVGLGQNGDVAFRQDSGAGTLLYRKTAGAWVASAA